MVVKTMPDDDDAYEAAARLFAAQCDSEARHINFVAADKEDGDVYLLATIKNSRRILIFRENER